MSEQIITVIGRKIKTIRQQKNLKLHEVAKKAGVSKSLLSKVENSRSVPSLPVLISIIQVLEVDFSTFFEDLEINGGIPYLHVKRADYTETKKEDSVGFLYRYILSKPASGIVVEAVLLELSPGSRRKKVTTDGHEFKYVISGRVDYHMGEKVVTMEAGDSLFFDGRIPHVPVNPYDEPCVMLVVYLLSPPQG